MTDYTELIRSLRNCSNNRCAPCDCGWFDKYQVDESCKEIIMWKAADAIDALQAELIRICKQLPKRGKWIWDDKRCIYVCSMCGSPKVRENMDRQIIKEQAYCYSCGAKMEVQDG